MGMPRRLPPKLDQPGDHLSQDEEAWNPPRTRPFFAFREFRAWFALCEEGEPALPATTARLLTNMERSHPPVHLRSSSSSQRIPRTGAKATPTECWRELQLFVFESSECALPRPWHARC
jgi:hypothetical protein